MDKRYASLQTVKSVDTDNRIIEFTASKEVADYDNDIVKIEGIDISKIKKNKSFLWSHQQGMPPIGKILKVWKDGKELKGKAQLTSEEEYPFGYTIYKLISGGYINNVSISFLPDWPSVEYKEDKKTGNRTQVITKSTLLEISAVNVGCNASTSIQVKSLKDSIDKAWNKGVIDGLELNQLEEALYIKEVEPEEIDYAKEIELLKEEMAELKSGSYLYSLFDKEPEEKDSIDTVYKELMNEKKQIHQKAIDIIKS